MTTVVDKFSSSSHDIVFICDFSPPRGSNDKLLDTVKYLEVDFISVAYNPGKSTRTNSAFVAHWIKQNSRKEVIFTIATRDMNKVAIQSLLLGADLAGLENVVVVMGDKFSEQEQVILQSVNDYKPTELVEAINEMNAGRDFKGLMLQNPTNLCPGATIDLWHEWEQELRLTHKKVKAGAKYFLLQAIFDPKRVTDFLKIYADTYGEEILVPLFCGIQLVAPNSIIFGETPHWVKEDLERDRGSVDIALQILGCFIDEGFRSIYLVPPILRGGSRDYDMVQDFLETYRRG